MYHFFKILPMCVYAKSLQSCLTLCSSMNYSLPGSSIHGILQARVLEWVTMPSPGNRRFFTISAIWEVFVFCFYFLDSAYKQYYMVFDFLCLSMIISRFIHVAANEIISFFLMADWYYIDKCTTSSLSLLLTMNV